MLHALSQRFLEHIVYFLAYIIQLFMQWAIQMYFFTQECVSFAEKWFFADLTKRLRVFCGILILFLIKF